MTIASAFNEIAVANGGTADNSGTITGALDALTDALAGSDQPAPQTIEQGVRMLGEHIGGGGGGVIINGSAQVYNSALFDVSVVVSANDNMSTVVSTAMVANSTGLTVGGGLYLAVENGNELVLRKFIEDSSVGLVTPARTDAVFNGAVYTTYLIEPLNAENDDYYQIEVEQS